MTDHGWRHRQKFLNGWRIDWKTAWDFFIAGVAIALVLYDIFFKGPA